MSNLMQSAKSVYSTGLNIEWSTPRRARTISSENGNLDILYIYAEPTLWRENYAGQIDFIRRRIFTYRIPW